MRRLWETSRLAGGSSPTTKATVSRWNSVTHPNSSGSFRYASLINMLNLHQKLIMAFYKWALNNYHNCALAKSSKLGNLLVQIYSTNNATLAVFSWKWSTLWVWHGLPDSFTIFIVYEEYRSKLELHFCSWQLFCTGIF